MKLFVFCATLCVSVSTTFAKETDSLKIKEQAKSTKDGAAVFGLFLGRDNLKDVALKVKLQKDSNCKISSLIKECRPTYEIEKRGNLERLGYSVNIQEDSVYYDVDGVSPNKAEVLFTKFSIDGEYLTGTFFKNTLIALSVNSSSLGKDLDSSVDVAALMASFDNKYKKEEPPFVKTSTISGVTYKETYFQWRDLTGKFDIQLTRMDSILVNKSDCLQDLKVLLNISLDYYNRSKYRCEGSFVKYRLDYRAQELYEQAFDQARKLKEEKEAQKNKAKTDRLNKF